MKTLLKYSVLLAVLLSAGVTVLPAQDTSAVPEYYSEDSLVEPVVLNRAVMSPEEWDHLANDAAFAYRDKREAAIEKEKSDSGWLEKALNDFFGFFASGAGTFIFWLLVFSVLGYILYQIFKGDVSRLFGRSEKAVREEETAGQLSREDLLSADWQTAMQAAVAVQDFRPATRLAFVHTLQLLHKSGHISYRIDATNYEYYRSVKNEEIRQLLQQLLLRYEYAWFGRMPVDRAQWEQTFAVYSRLKSIL